MRLDQVMQPPNDHTLNECNHARQVECGFETVFLSAVLAYAIPHPTRSTVITNPVIRTAEMVDAAGVLFVKQPQDGTLCLASEFGIPSLVTRFGMFKVGGHLFATGIPPACCVE